MFVFCCKKIGRIEINYIFAVDVVFLLHINVRRSMRFFECRRGITAITSEFNLNSHIYEKQFITAREVFVLERRPALFGLPGRGNCCRTASLLKKRN